MTASAHQSCPPHSDGTCEGSDQETGGSFATSRVEGQRETVTPGAATDDTLSALVPLVSGGVIRFSAVHGRVDMQIRLGKGRSWQTTPVTAERAEYFAQRLAEIAQHARAQRQAKGA